MKPSTKAALLSGLVFPGLGQFILGRKWRGMTFLSGAAVSLYFIFSIMLEKANALAARIARGEIAADPETVMHHARQATADTLNSGASLASMVLAAIWLLALLDALWPQAGTPDTTGADD